MPPVAALPAIAMRLHFWLNLLLTLFLFLPGMTHALWLAVRHADATPSALGHARSDPCCPRAHASGARRGPGYRALGDRRVELDWKTGRILTSTLPCENSLRVTLSEAISAPQRRSKKLSAQRTANEQDNKEYQLASLNKMSAMSRKPVRSAVSNAGNGAR